MSADAGRSTERAVAGRHKIHDRDMAVTGYELVFGEVSRSNAEAAESSRVITSQAVFTESGGAMSDLLSRLRVFCAADEDVLSSDVSLTLPPSSVIEVSAEVPDARSLAAYQRLAEQGYALALDGVPEKEHADALLDLASVVRIDTQRYCRDELSTIVDSLRPHDVELLAANIDALPQLHHARRLDFDLFSGPAVQTVYSAFRVSARPASIKQLRLAVDLLGDDLEFDRIESLLRPEPHLSYQVMQLASLGRIGETRRSIRTIRDALVSAGTWRVQQWIALLGAFPADPDNDDRIFETLLRASACEHLAEQVVGRNSARMAFAAGTLSSFADLLDPRGSDMSELDLADDLREAAFGEDSPMAKIVRDVVEYQSGTKAARHISGLSRSDLDEAFAAAFLWAIEATSSLR